MNIITWIVIISIFTLLNLLIAPHVKKEVLENVWENINRNLLIIILAIPPISIILLLIWFCGMMLFAIVDGIKEYFEMGEYKIRE